jgi:methyl-accepting chemotaxis protein
MEIGTTTQSAKKFQRKTVLVKKSLQLKYIGLIFASVAVALIIMGFDLYYTMYRLVLMDNPSIIPLLHRADSIFLLRAVIYLSIIFVVSLFISNRLAGPIYRFEKSTQVVGSGDLTHRVSLRTGDELLELQEEFNGMVSSLQSLVQRDRNLIRRLSSRLESLRNNLNDGSPAALKDELRSIQAEIEHITSGFKV